jgi:hypothetical protein
MSQFKSATLAHERKRWMRPDAHRFIRPDWRRYVQPGSELAALYESMERKYSPDQPRDYHGRWTDEGGPSTSDTGQQSSDGISPDVQMAGTLIYVCIAGSFGRFTINGIQSYWVTYECADGRSFVREGSGHSFPVIVIDPFR